VISKYIMGHQGVKTAIEGVVKKPNKTGYYSAATAAKAGVFKNAAHPELKINYNNLKTLIESLEQFKPIPGIDEQRKNVTYFLTFAAFKKQVTKIIDFLLFYPVCTPTINIDMSKCSPANYTDLVMCWNSIVLKKVLSRLGENGLQVHQLLPSYIDTGKSVQKFDKDTFELDSQPQSKKVGKYTTIPEKYQSEIEQRSTILKPKYGSMLQPKLANSQSIGLDTRMKQTHTPFYIPGLRPVVQPQDVPLLQNAPVAVGALPVANAGDNANAQAEAARLAAAVGVGVGGGGGGGQE